ncbi:MAG: endonuclease/exonuclease/phosphatase family protein [Bradymonadaceae bacterium]
MISPLYGEGRRSFFRVLLLAGLVLLVVKWLAATPSLTVATFNIEEFPQSDEQVAGAFEAIAETGVQVVAVQEIIGPERFRHAARKRLEGDWRAVFPDQSPETRPGVLFDRNRFTLEATYTHEETVVYEGARPVFEVELTGDGGTELEVFVVHLKAGSHGLPVRREQHGALVEILGHHQNGDRRTIVLGDFNSTEPQDRELLAGISEGSSLRWLSRRTGCTGYWIPEESCRSFTLDHVFADGLGAKALSRGPCERVGCDPGRQCPIFHERVSDHCPVTVQLVPK